MMPSEGTQPPLHALQPGALCLVRAADAVVAHLDPQGAVGVLHADVDLARAGVPDRVGEDLGDREVAGRLDRRGQPAGQVDVDPDRQRGVQGQGLHRVAEAAVGQHRRVDAADQVAQVAQRPRRGLPGLGDQGQRRLRAGRQHAFDRTQVHAQRDQAGLGPVVQVSLDPAQLGRGGVDGVAAGLGQLLDPAGQLGIGPGVQQGPRVRADRPGHQPGRRRPGIRTLASAPASRAICGLLTWTAP